VERDCSNRRAGQRIQYHNHVSRDGLYKVFLAKSELSRSWAMRPEVRPLRSTVANSVSEKLDEYTAHFDKVKHNV